VENLEKSRFSIGDFLTIFKDFSTLKMINYHEVIENFMKNLFATFSEDQKNFCLAGKNLPPVRVIHLFH